jgi:hypothetical protein
MPQVDYSKIVIYKIQHKELDELLYVGSTTHFRNRKVNHKSRCYDANGRAYNYKLYSTIRDNGGWDAFNMVIIKEFPCNSIQEARTEEDRIMREMRSSLNMCRAYQTTEERRDYLKKHEQKDKIKETRKHYRELNKNILNQKAGKKIICECGCVIRKDSIARHKHTKKHQEYLNQQTDQ